MLWLELTPMAVLFSGAVLFLASVIRGFAGFGFSSVLIVGLLFHLPATQIVPLSIALEVIASLGQARGIFGDINRKYLLVLLATGLLGSPIGVYALSYAPPETLRIGVQVFVFVTAALLLLRPITLRDVRLPILALAGFVAGVANGATALSGMVLALFFSTTTLSSGAMRATMIAYFFFTDVWTGGILAAAGHYDPLTLKRFVCALPVMALGLWVGSLFFQHTRQRGFRKYILGLLVGLSALGLIAG